VRQAKVVAPVDDVPFDFGQQASPVEIEVPEVNDASPAPTKPAVAQEQPAQPSEQTTAPEPAPAADALAPAEKLVQLSAQAGVELEAVEAWAKARRLNASKDSDAAKIINAWRTVKAALKAQQGGAK